METERNSRNNAPAYSDEIDLFQLCAELWRKRLLIILCTVAVLACGVGYAYWAPVVYKAEASLLPPPESFLSQLEVGNTVSIEEAFDLTNQYLGSEEVKRALLNSPVVVKFVGEASSKATELKMSVSLPSQRNNTVVSIEWHHPGQAAELVNTWVELAMQGAREELVRNARVVLQEKIGVIDQQIEVKKKQALSQLDAELFQLREAKIIADKTGLLGPVDLGTENLVTNKSSYSNVMGLRSLYLLGSKALSAEINTLELRREKAEGYAPGLSGLEAQRSTLQKVRVELDVVQTAKVDTMALPPGASIKPKRMSIILASLVLGVMVGIFVALILLSVEKRKGMQGYQ